MTTTQAPPDPRPMLRRALDQVGDLAATATPADLGAPTPCAGWTVADLLGHLVTVHQRILRVATGGDAVDLPLASDPPRVGGGDPFAHDRAAIDAAWSDDDVLVRTATVPWGTHPGTVLGWGYVRELTVHAWDLDRALGQRHGGTARPALDPELAGSVLEMSRRALPAEPRGGPIPFGPVVEVAPDSDPYVRLVAWLGRTP
jgi:uncharacterized protein (TIGR03086 family)